MSLGVQIYTLLFILLGIAAIAAAIKYTVGKGAYGYSGFGDLFVFIFFGITGVCGSYYLQTQQFHWSVLLLGAAIGCFSVGVLNLNNMRDRESDMASNKNTVVVKMGAQLAKYYHAALIVGGLCTSFYYLFHTSFGWWAYLPLLTYPIFIFHNKQIQSISNPADFDPYLKKLALSTFLFSVLFAIGQVLTICLS